MKFYLIVSVLVFSFSLLANAQEKKSASTSAHSNIMLLLGRTNILGGDLNKHLKSQNIEEQNSINEVSFEASFANDVFSVGSRLNYMELYAKSSIGNSDTAYLRSINYLFALRNYFINTEHHKLSLLLAGGLSWMEINLNQAVGVTKYDVTPLSIDPAANAGLTYMVGFDILSFAIEGGYSWNEFKSLRQHEKFYAESLNSIDLSGWYIKSGIVFHLR